MVWVWGHPGVGVGVGVGVGAAFKSGCPAVKSLNLKRTIMCVKLVCPWKYKSKMYTRQQKHCLVTESVLTIIERTNIGKHNRLAQSQNSTGKCINFSGASVQEHGSLQNHYVGRDLADMATKLWLVVLSMPFAHTLLYWMSLTHTHTQTQKFIHSHPP